jgi:hypothetical protein
VTDLDVPPAQRRESPEPYEATQPIPWFMVGLVGCLLAVGITGSINVKGAPFTGAMPAFKQQFSDEQLAATAVGPWWYPGVTMTKPSNAASRPAQSCAASFVAGDITGGAASLKKGSG